MNAIDKKNKRINHVVYLTFHKNNDRSSLPTVASNLLSWLNTHKYT